MPNCSRATRSCTAGFVSRSCASLANESSSIRSADTLVRSSASCRRIVIQSAVPYSPPHTASASNPTPPAIPAMRMRVTGRRDDGRDSAPRPRVPRRCGAADCTARRAAGLDLPDAGRDREIRDERVLGLARTVRDHRAVAIAPRQLDALQRLGECADLIHLDEDGVRDALFDAPRQPLDIGAEEIVPYKLHPFL